MDMSVGALPNVLEYLQMIMTDARWVMAMSKHIQHNAPAGQKYTSIRDAGEQILATYCQGFPQSPDQESFILPILFKSEHPENVDQDDKTLSEADKRSLKGLDTNIRGERGEYEVYKVFYTVVRQSPTESVLVLHGYGLDNDNGRGLKKHAIMTELPFIDLSGVNMKKEHDFIVIVKYIGIVVCEVKTSASAENIASAEGQLHNSATFAQQILTAIGGPTTQQLPVVKVIVVPHESSTTSSPRKHNDCHVIYQDDLHNFTPKWTQLVNELKVEAGTSSVPKNVFESFVQFLVGVWSMKPITKRSYDFDNDHASLATEVTAIDTTLNKAEFAPTKQAQKLTSDVATSMNEIFQKVDDFNVMYLSPQQKLLYDNYKHALIHSHAGTGKTMLIIFKIIELLRADPTQKVLLVAPEPHHLRMQKILNKQNITTNIITKFPNEKPKARSTSQATSALPTCDVHRLQQILNKHSITTDIASKLSYTKPETGSTSQQSPPIPTCDVLIITIQDFFQVRRQTLYVMQYDVSTFNIFVDDMHFYKVPRNHRENGISTFADIGDFIDNTYNHLNTTNQYAWFAFDVVQQGQRYNDDEVNCRSDRLFVTSYGSPRTFNIPVVKMTNVLRSTKEITDVIVLARQTQMILRDYDTNHVITDIGCGHHITTGARVLYEKLQSLTGLRQVKSFVCDRVYALLRNLTTETFPQPSYFPYSTVAILFEDDEDLQQYKSSLESMIRQEFNVGVQTIKDQLVSNNNIDVIIDHSGNIQSFESPTVIFVRPWSMSYNFHQTLYNILSRARTLCAVIDVQTQKPPLRLKHVDYILWKEVNGAFQKVNSDPQGIRGYISDYTWTSIYMDWTLYLTSDHKLLK